MFNIEEKLYFGHRCFRVWHHRTIFEKVCLLQNTNISVSESSDGKSDNERVSVDRPEYSGLHVWLFTV